MGDNRVVNRPEYTSVKPYSIFAVFDLELTGLNPDEDKTIEAAIVLCDENGKILFVWESLINPNKDTGPVHIHHITNDMVANAPCFEQVAPDIIELCNNRIKVGLNNSLDFAVFKREFDELGIRYKPGDSLDLSDLLRDEKFTDMFYDEIMEAINSQESEHRAMPDTMVAAAILPYALKFAKIYPERVKKLSRCEVVAVDPEPLHRDLTRNFDRIGYIAPE
ncbi:MAG: 3'-5' exonuclease [Acidimicrobiia bacterium]